MAEAGFQRFWEMVAGTDFESLPLFNRPLFSWSLRTDYVGRRLIYRPDTESTLWAAQRMLERWRLSSGAVLLAEVQKLGPDSYSPPNINLYFTLVLLDPPSEARRLAYVTPLAIARAVEEVAASNGIDLRVEFAWPSEVLVDGRRLGGVDIDMTSNAEGQQAALVSVEINVNLDLADYPELAGAVTSLKEALGRSVARELVLAAFCNHFEALYERSIAGDDAPFEAWRGRLVTLGREVVVARGGGTLHGVAVEVEADGALVIETPDGRRGRVEAGEARLNPNRGVQRGGSPSARGV